MNMPELAAFSLVGGASFSLLYGHRKSVGLDLFSTLPFEGAVVIKALQEKFKQFFVNRSTNTGFGIFCFIDEIKVDTLRYPHPLIRPQLNAGGIRLLSIEDTIAMKIQAVLGRGKKRFWGYR
jgi:hypothetical protein